MKFDSFKVLEGNFRSYDVRGEYPHEIDASTAYAVAVAFVKFNPCKKVVVGYDHRHSTPALRDGLIQGLIDSGVDVWDIGQVTTDITYFASWFYSAHNNSTERIEGAVMITASHMPGKFNGLKFITKELKPIGKGVGMEELYQLASQIDEFTPVSDDQKGRLTQKDVLPDYLNWLWSFVDKNKIDSFKIVMDCGNGVAGPIVEKVFEPFSFDLTKLFFEPDASFPNHEANPILPENRVDLINKVKEVGADLGIAWDADADRCYFIDEKGEFVHGDFITALLAISFLEQAPGTDIVYDIRASKVVPEIVAKHGGKSHKEKVGHAHIKKRMREVNAIFGGEVSGHYYFKANHYMDNGFIPALLVIQLLSESKKPLSELIAQLGNYFVSGEINSEVHDRDAVMKKLKEVYADAEIEEMDGVSIEYVDWRCNVRPSANDPVIRLNLEASSQELMEQKRDEVLKLIRE